MIEVRVPGKLYIAGEYNVLNKGGNAIVAAVDRFLTTTITSSNNFQFESGLSSFKWIVTNNLPQFNYSDEDYSKHAIYQAFKYLRYLNIETKPFKLTVDNQLFYKGIKLGLGSSAALTLGIIKAVLLFNNIEISNNLWFKLAVLSQIDGNYLSSGGDLASIINEGWTYYERYDLVWLLHHKGDYDYIIKNDWPALKIESLIVSDNFKLKGVWSQVPHYNNSINFNLSLDKSNNYKNFVINSTNYVNNLKESLISENLEQVHLNINALDKNLRRYHIHLKQKGYDKNFKWYYHLRDQFNLIGKISGAGFGDFAYIISHPEGLINHDIINKAFNKYGLIPFDFNIVKNSNVVKESI